MRQMLDTFVARMRREAAVSHMLGGFKIFLGGLSLLTLIVLNTVLVYFDIFGGKPH